MSNRDSDGCHGWAINTAVARHLMHSRSDTSCKKVRPVRKREVGINNVNFVQQKATQNSSKVIRFCNNQKVQEEKLQAQKRKLDRRGDDVLS